MSVPHRQSYIGYFGLGRVAKYCDQCVRLSVCLFAYLKNHTSKFHQIFCTCYLWPWLSPPLIIVQYIVYFWFC